jgi:hypothetical protein
MLDEWFATAPKPTPARAWQHVYRLLLWIDRTTGLAHCYESDKAQPGRPWYARSLAFHDWLGRELEAEATNLGGAIDWLFKRGTERLAEAAARVQAERLAAAGVQRHGYEDFPVPGTDPELEALIIDELTPWLSEEPPRDAVGELTQKVRTYFTQENKRRNLTGEGFEDTLAALLSRLPGSERLEVRPRARLHELPGFREPPGRQKIRKVDLGLVKDGLERSLTTVKWSIRADREDQYQTDFTDYARLEDENRDFGFVLVTNEFDAARLAAACDLRRENAFLFTAVVHVNPRGPYAAYGSEKRRGAAARLEELVQSGRLVSLEQWLTDLTS